MANTYLDVLDDLLSSFDGWRYHQGDGTMALGWIQAPEDQAADHTIVATDLATDYQVVESSGSPPRSVEVEYLHIGHTEQGSELLADALARDRAAWRDEARTVEERVGGGETLYPLSPPEPTLIPARWTTRLGADVEATRLRDRIKDREGGSVALTGPEWFYGTLAPGEYLSVSHPKVPGGTVSLVVFSADWDLGKEILSASGWGAIKE